MRRVLLAVLLFGFPTTAGAAPTIGLAVEPDGNPRVMSNPMSFFATERWSICTPDSNCSDGGSGVEIKPGDVPAGTTFKVTIEDGGTTGVAISSVWGGRITSTQAPGLLGNPVVGAHMIATAGTWTGGWDAPFDEIQVQVCRTTTMTGCVVIDDSFYTYGEHTVLEAPDAGGYVFAVHEHLTGQYAFPAYKPAHRGTPPLVAGQTVAVSAPLGPVQPSPYATITPTPTPTPPSALALARRVGNTVGAFAAQGPGR